MASLFTIQYIQTNGFDKIQRMKLESLVYYIFTYLSLSPFTTR